MSDNERKHISLKKIKTEKRYFKLLYPYRKKLVGNNVLKTQCSKNVLSRNGGGGLGNGGRKKIAVLSM